MRIHQIFDLKGPLIMISLPTTFISVIAIFAPVFSWPVWEHAKVLIAGAILAPGSRTAVYCADRRFIAILEVEGFTVINPEAA